MLIVRSLASIFAFNIYNSPRQVLLSALLYRLKNKIDQGRTFMLKQSP